MFFPTMSNRWLSPLLCALAAVVILATAAPAQAQSGRWDVAVNNWTFSAEPTAVYKNSAGGLFANNTRFYSRFTEEAIPVETASFHFYVQVYNNVVDVELYGVSPYYDENAINWITQPTAGALIGSVSVTGIGWYSVDVASYINAQVGQPIAIIADSPDAIYTELAYLPSLNHTYIQYTAAPGIKPPAPTNCYNFDDNTDFLGGADFALNPIATVGELAGVVDTGLHTADGGIVATFPALATSANNGFTFAGWWQVNDEFDYYELISSDTNFRFLVEGGEQVTVASPYGNTVTAYDELNSGWNYLAGGISASGAGHVVANANYYTNTVSSPWATAANIELTAPPLGRVDGFMYWDSVLSEANHIWLWNGGHGRSCYEFGTPSQVITYTVTINPPVAPFTSTLPLENQLDFFLTATVGDMSIALSVLLLTVVTAVVAIRWYGSKDNE